MTKELVETKKNAASGFMMNPANFSEAKELAQMLCESDCIPKHFKGKPGDILIVINRGLELGFTPFQALEAFSVINGKLCMGGDAALALVQASPSYMYHRDELIGENEANPYHRFIIKRKNNDEHEVTFSVLDAKKAGLWGKTGPWTQYPKRMLKYRALSFALRDKFPDVLRGIGIKEEVMDYEIIPQGNGIPLAREKLRSTTGSRADALAEIINPVQPTPDVAITDGNFEDDMCVDALLDDGEIQNDDE